MRIYSIAFALSLVILLSFSVLLYRSINTFSEYSYSVEHTQVVLNNIQRVHAVVVDAETGQRGFLLTHDSTFLSPMLVATMEVPVILDSLKMLTADNPSQQPLVDTLRNVVSARLHHMQEALNRSPLISAEQLVELLQQGNVKMVRFRNVIAALTENEQALFVMRSNKKLESAEITPTYFKLIIAVTMSIALISFLLLYKELSERLEAQKLLEKRYLALNRSNAELRQIAYVTSHDLQEPLRKIRIFSDALVLKSRDKFPEEMLSIMERIDANALKARELVADLSAFAALSAPDEKLAEIDVMLILKRIQQSLAAEMANRKAVIIVDDLAPLFGYPNQIHLLFKELLDNAIKFSQPHGELVVKITTSMSTGKEVPFLGGSRAYRIITVSDNGIGFEMEYAVRIFELFQRLHSQEDGFSGKGFGLSLCQRVMANHDGFIDASGKKGVGANFNLYFPV